METEEREERGSGRSQNVVHTLPRSMASVPKFITGPLERLDPASGTTQVLVITLDPESAVAMAEAVLRMTGPAGIELFPVTSARRAARLMAGRPVLAVAASPRDIQDLVRGSHLKLDDVRSVILAWADEILSGDPEDIEALESLMGELPKDAARIVVTSRSEGRVNAFAERYLRRAPRDVSEEPTEDLPPVPLQYVTVSAAARIMALRRLLDDLDPPSAAVVVASAETEALVSNTLQMLGYRGDSAAVTVSRDESIPERHAVIFFELPADRKQLAAAALATPVTIIAMVEPRELMALRRIAGGSVKPFIPLAPGNTARDREAALRRELGAVIDRGLPAREVLALEPMLERHDGIEIAAAALRLLERERALRRNAESDARAHSDAAPGGGRGTIAADRRPASDRPRPADRRPSNDRRPSGPPRGRDFGGAREGGGSGLVRGGRPPRGAGGFRDSRPPRDAAHGPGEGRERPRDDRGRRPPQGGSSRPPRRDRP